MFTELGRVIETCSEELDAKIRAGGGDEQQVTVTAKRIHQWFSRIQGQSRRCERHVFEALGKKD